MLGARMTSDQSILVAMSVVAVTASVFRGHKIDVVDIRCGILGRNNLDFSNMTTHKLIHPLLSVFLTLFSGYQSTQIVQMCTSRQLRKTYTGIHVTSS
jgi:hypothetical protein